MKGGDDNVEIEAQVSGKICFSPAKQRKCVTFVGAILGRP